MDISILFWFYPLETFFVGLTGISNKCRVGFKIFNQTQAKISYFDKNYSLSKCSPPAAMHFRHTQPVSDEKLINKNCKEIHENQLRRINCCHFSVRLSKETIGVSNDLYTFRECDKNNICFIEVFTGSKYSFENVYVCLKHPVGVEARKETARKLKFNKLLFLRWCF